MDGWSYNYGRYLSLLESVKGFEKINPVRIIEPIYKDNPDFLLNKSIIDVYNGQKLFVVLDGRSLFSFHKDTKDVSKIFRFIVGINYIGKGIQFTGFGAYKVGNTSIFFIKNNFFKNEKSYLDSERSFHPDLFPLLWWSLKE